MKNSKVIRGRGSRNSKRGRRGLILLVLVIGGLTWWLGRQATICPVQHVRLLMNAKYIERRWIQSVMTRYLHQGLFKLDIYRLKNELLALPWIYAVDVRRQWPNTLIVKILEQRAVAQWQSGVAAINIYGQTFNVPVGAVLTHLPMLAGPDDKLELIFKTYQQGTLLLHRFGLRIEKLSLTSQHHWEILLNNQVVIYLREQQPLAQLELFSKIYQRVILPQGKPAATIDLRYPKGFALKWRDVSLN